MLIIFIRRHRAKSRKIVDGQMIHASVIFRPGYKPGPSAPKKLHAWPPQLHWDDPEQHKRLSELGKIWEKTLFDKSEAHDLFCQLAPEQLGNARILESIAFMASSGQCPSTHVTDTG